MGYTTDFVGQFKLDKPLEPNHKAYLEKFAETRRMKRNAELTNKREDAIREAVGLPVGEDGCYFVGEDGSWGQKNSGDIIDYNKPPGQIVCEDIKKFNQYWDENQRLIKDGKCQPSLWCQWIPNDDGTAIVWDGAEKFYYYIEWIKYLIEHFLSKWGYVLNGEVQWQGEDDDSGIIKIVDNEVTI